jgi:hypothetical protein
MENGASIAAPDEPAIEHTAAREKNPSGEGFMAPDYSS